MKSSIFATVGAAAVAGLIVLANPATAHGEFGGGRGGGKLFASSFQIAHMAQRLDMTEEQKAQLRGVLDAARPEADRLADAMVANRQAMKAFRETETFSEAEVRAIADQRGELVADMTVLYARVHAQIKEILTPEQLERFEKMRMGHRGKRHHEGKFHHDPQS
jgi:Spy/CpxP family protein refolding chaperone